MTTFESHDIRFCNLDEAPRLQDFIATQWAATHAFVLSQELLDWQHRDKDAGRYNFCVAFNRNSREFDAVLGFIPTSTFDSGLSSRRELWLALWKAREGNKHPGLGVALLKFILQTLKPSYVGALGLSKKVVPLYRRLGFTTGLLRQFVMPNAAITDFRLFVPNAIPVSHAFSEGGDRPLEHDLQSLRTIGNASFPEAGTPAKSAEYLVQRYLLHPLYKYRIHGLGARGSEAAFVTRECEALGRKALRIVDYVGPDTFLSSLGPATAKLLKATGCEYADFYASGVDADMLQATGFFERTLYAGTIAPNYFEPFEQSNVNIDTAFLSPNTMQPRIFKGDADQDRPNIIREGHSK